MSINLQQLARAIVEQAASLPAKDFPLLADAAMKILADHGAARHATRLIRTVQRLQKRHGAPSVSIETPTALSENDQRSFEEELTTTLHRPVFLETHVQQNLIGGLRVQVNDERLDMSLRSELEHLKSVLSTHF